MTRQWQRVGKGAGEGRPAARAGDRETATVVVGVVNALAGWRGVLLPGGAGRCRRPRRVRHAGGWQRPGHPGGGARIREAGVCKPGRVAHQALARTRTRPLTGGRSRISLFSLSLSLPREGVDTRPNARLQGPSPLPALPSAPPLPLPRATRWWRNRRRRRRRQQQRREGRWGAARGYTLTCASAEAPLLRGVTAGGRGAREAWTACSRL